MSQLIEDKIKLFREKFSDELDYVSDYHFDSPKKLEQFLLQSLTDLQRETRENVLNSIIVFADVSTDVDKAKLLAYLYKYKSLLTEKSLQIPSEGEEKK